jgi:hypothetical protein
MTYFKFSKLSVIKFKLIIYQYKNGRELKIKNEKTTIRYRSKNCSKPINRNRSTN